MSSAKGCTFDDLKCLKEVAHTAQTRNKVLPLGPHRLELASLLATTQTSEKTDKSKLTLKSIVANTRKPHNYTNSDIPFAPAV